MPPEVCTSGAGRQLECSTEGLVALISGQQLSGQTHRGGAPRSGDVESPCHSLSHVFGAKVTGSAGDSFMDERQESRQHW